MLIGRAVFVDGVRRPTSMDVCLELLPSQPAACLVLSLLPYSTRRTSYRSTGPAYFKDQFFTKTIHNQL